MKWKIRLARDMGQEASVVIEAPTSEEAEAILWHDMNPDVIQWSDDDVTGDREVHWLTKFPRSACAPLSVTDPRLRSTWPQKPTERLTTEAKVPATWTTRPSTASLLCNRFRINASRPDTPRVRASGNPAAKGKPTQ